MNKAEKIIELINLVDENNKKLEILNQEKELLKIKYSQTPKSLDIINKIKNLEKKYVVLYKKSLELNEQIHKLKNET